MMTVLEVVKKTSEFFASKGVESPRLNAELLIGHALGLARMRLYIEFERPVTDAELGVVRELVRRRGRREPVQHIIGFTEFCGLRLKTDRRALIPRPETELLVERALALLPETQATGELRVADLGTGSGAVALALASERPAWRLTATDQSEAALTVARANAARLQLGAIEFLVGDWFAPLAGRRFAAILSNPPYIALGDAALAALRHEPAAALSPGPSGLEALRQLIAQAPAHLEREGWLLLEHGADQADAVAAALVAAGYARVRCHCDLAGRDRVTEGRWLGVHP